MKKRLVYGLMALSLCAPAQARPGDRQLPAWAETLAQEDVFKFIVRCAGCANEQQVVDLVKANPELARRALEMALADPASKQPAERDHRYDGLFWIWARALGLEEFKPRLLAAGLEDKPMVFLDGYALTSDIVGGLISVGNFQQSERLLSALEKEQQTPNAQQRLFVAKARMVSGRYLLARQQGEALVELARAQSNPQELLELYACLLDAGRMGGFPDVTNRYLEPFQQAIAALPLEKQAFWRFYSSSFDELRRMEREPETSVNEFCGRYDKVWANIKATNPFEIPLLGRIFGHLSSLWMTRIADLYLLRNIQLNSPEDKRVEVSFMNQVNLLKGLSDAAPKADSKIPTYAAAMTLLALINDAHEQTIRVGQPDIARQLIPSMIQLETGFAQLEPQIQAQQQELGKLLQVIFGDRLGNFSTNLLEGDWSRQRTRMRLAQLQQLLADSKGKLSPDQARRAQKLADEAVTLNTRALRGIGYQGADDARWAVIEYQLRFRPPGWAKAAERLLFQLTEINQQLGYREGISRVAMLRGQLLAAQGQNPAAIQSLQQAVDNVESYLTEVEAGEAGSRAIRDRYKQAYRLLVKLQLNSGKATGAFQTVSRQLQAEVVQQNQESLRNNTQLRDVNRVRAETAALEKQVADERIQGKDAQASEQLLASSKGEYQRVVADLRRSHPQYEGAMAVRPVEFLELKKSIPADTTAVLYFVSDDGIYSFVASQQGDLKIHKVAVDPKELEKSVLRVRQLINLFPHDPALGAHPEAFRWNDPASPGYQRQSLPLKTELARLDKWLIDPIQADLGSRPVLAIVPTGVLHYVPFPALCSLDAAGNPKFLAENFQCVNLVKTSDLVPVAGGTQGQKLFAMGNPDGSLPGAEREVNSITASFPQSQKAVGKEATASRLKKLEAGTGYVHLATHGQLSEADPKNSYLVMAGTGDSAHFRATDIYDLDWQGVRLVTLSACKTALQEGKPGAAITSLAEAFRVAGGHSVVASLWSVEDNATEELMVEFYKQLAQGKSLAAALQSSERSLSAQPRYSHPFFWAAFTLFGDWR